MEQRRRLEAQVTRQPALALHDRRLCWLQHRHTKSCHRALLAPFHCSVTEPRRFDAFPVHVSLIAMSVSVLGAGCRWRSTARASHRRVNAARRPPQERCRGGCPPASCKLPLAAKKMRTRCAHASSACDAGPTLVCSRVHAPWGAEMLPARDAQLQPRPSRSAEGLCSCAHAVTQGSSVAHVLLNHGSSSASASSVLLM